MQDFTTHIQPLIGNLHTLFALAPVAVIRTTTEVSKINSFVFSSFYRILPLVIGSQLYDLEKFDFLGRV